MHQIGQIIWAKQCQEIVKQKFSLQNQFSELKKKSEPEIVGYFIVKKWCEIMRQNQTYEGSLMREAVRVWMK